MPLPCFHQTIRSILHSFAHHCWPLNRLFASANSRLFFPVALWPCFGHVSAMFRPCFGHLRSVIRCIIQRNFRHNFHLFSNSFQPLSRWFFFLFSFLFFSLMDSYQLRMHFIGHAEAIFITEKKRDLGRVPKRIFRPFRLLFIIIIVIVIIILFFSRLLIHFESLFLPWFPFGSVDVRRFS